MLEKEAAVGRVGCCPPPHHGAHDLRFPPEIQHPLHLGWNSDRLIIRLLVDWTASSIIFSFWFGLIGASVDQGV
uniref:Uncharacterized protein n=1 Tax=Helianthus annuus TaxID=4232 RepID=A0A251ULM1_HELAN